MQNTDQNLSIAVVILNWNGRHFLEKYLPGVESYSQLPGVSVIVADNASTDDSLSYLQKNHPNIQVIKLDKNYGFAEGYNIALQQITSEYYVLLNSDAEVTEGWLQPMLELMQQKPDIAACMPKIRSTADQTSFEYAGAAGGFIDKYGYTFCQGRLFNTIEKDSGQYDTETEVFWATGACCMIKAPLFHQMGGFDTSFYAHMEEIDLCWRLKNAGYSIWYTPHSTVYHVGGGMLPQSSSFKTFLNYRNNLLMLYKNLPKRDHRRTLFIRMVLDLVSAIYASLRGNISIIKTIYKAHTAYRKIRKKYGHISDRPLSYPSCVYSRSIVYQYFIKGIQKYSNLPKK